MSDAATSDRDPVTRWVHAAKLPLPTLVTFLVFALVFWVNAVVNRYLFNVVLALLATVPVLFLLAVGALDARKARHAVQLNRDTPVD